jgi:hypothetical protein
MAPSTLVGAAPAPLGVTPNFEEPTDVLRTVNYVTQTLSIIFVTVFIGLKHYAKSSVLRGTWNVEDCKATRGPLSRHWDMHRHHRKITDPEDRYGIFLLHTVRGILRRLYIWYALLPRQP